MTGIIGNSSSSRVPARYSGTDLEAGKLGFVDGVPYQDASRLEGVKGITVPIQPGEEVANLGFNSNPLKPKDRELLNPTVRQALEYAIPRQQIIDTMFGGHAVPWANILSEWSGPSGWLNPAVTPRPSLRRLVEPAVVHGQRRPAAGAGLEDGGLPGPAAALHPAGGRRPDHGARRQLDRLAAEPVDVLQVLLHQPPSGVLSQRGGR